MDNGSSPDKDSSQYISDTKVPTRASNPGSVNQEEPHKGNGLGSAYEGYLKTQKGDTCAIVSSLAAHWFMWFSLAGFLFLPGSFPKIERILYNSGVLNNETDFTPYIRL